MPYVYRHFIPQNIAPSEAKRIVVLDSDGHEVARIPLGPLTPPAGEPLYRFGIISDLHVHHNPYVSWHPVTKLDNALSFFESQGCAFVAASGDITNTGFYLRTDEAVAGTEYLDTQQFAAYKAVVGKHTIIVYILCGNHESYYGKPITLNLGLLEQYTGQGALSYAVEHGGDLFIFCGQDAGSSVMSDEDFQWLGQMLEENKDRRCFVFVHSHIDDNVEGGVEDSGNPAFSRENSIFGYWGAAKTAAFINLMRQYPNVILFHGHTHIKFEAQAFDPAANYSEENGFKSVHVPSLGAPRTLVSADGTWQADDAGSQGYIVDVFEEYIILRGWDFAGEKPVPLGTYRIDTGVTT